jgi:iron complex outermembrane recepter protein
MTWHPRGAARGCAQILLLALILVGSARAAAPAERTFHFDIPAEALSQALRAFGQTAGEQIIFTEDLVRGISSGELRGEFSSTAALERLLEGTGLIAERSPTGVIMIHRATSSGKAADGPPATSSIEATPATRKEGDYLQEIVVTGTHLKDVTDTASPLLVFTRADIDQTGLATVGAFIQSLPQNFGNTSETTIASVAGGLSADNAVNGTGVNLHGMGGDATLVLVDGHRVAPGSVDGNFVDVSMIPLSAVERIEILTDGASAIYGADAVGGVVNIIMRKDFDGLETRARAGTVSQGASHETEAAQTAGTHWGSGSALVTYEYYDHTPLSAADRAFTASAPLPFTLLPEQLRQSVFASLDQSLGKDVSFFADGLYSHRWTYTDATVVGAFSQYSPSSIDEYSGTAGGRWQISSTTELELTGTYASTDTDNSAYDAGTPAPAALSKTVTRVWSVDPVLRGSLATLPAGALEYAVGAQYRGESYDATDYVAQSEFRPQREVEAAFAEVRVPVISPSMAIPAAQRVEVTLADREEHYSDFGATNNPTFGLIWRPISRLKVRGTYGRSFVAPLLSELNPVPYEVVGFNTSILPGSAPPGGDVNELVVFGGNPQLSAQTARTWTVGADWQAPGEGGLQAHLNYYSIDFSDRITNLQAAGYNVFYALPMAPILGPQIVRLNPSAALIGQLTSSPGFVNFGATNLTDFAAVIDSRELNLSAVDTRGLDLSLSYRAGFGHFNIEPGIDTTYILKLSNRFTATTPSVSILNTLYNPTRFKARGHLMLTDAPWSLAVFVNYVSSYENNVTTQQVTPIASWTTVDMTAGYICEACVGPLRDLDISTGVLNLANRAPPFAANANGYAVNYDGANASPLGRYLFLQLEKQW